MIDDMKHMFVIMVTILSMVMSHTAFAQKSSDPEGCLTYAMPSTVILLEVEAVQESFYAGPYARYAEKYLGIKVRQKNETSFQIVQVGVTPMVEADLSKRYVVAVKKGNVNGTFLKLSSAGLLCFADGNYGSEVKWRFPMESRMDFSDKGVSSNLKSEATVLYRNERKESEYNKVSYQQNMLVEKTLEQKAAEAAQMIVRLREQRLQIVTGDTDATYSGEAMSAAVNELTRLEKEYMSLFTGYSEKQVQTKRFEVIPSAEKESQMYVAFRLSDSAGLVPADNLSGKPVVMELIPGAVADPVVDVELNPKGQYVNYMIPAICTLKLKEGSELLVQTRMPVYQLGKMGSMPVNTIL